MGVLKNFLSNKDGNYAVMFAIAALPIVGAVGVAVDYSNLSRLNYNLSDAVDSMCSVVAREYMDGKNAADVKLAGEKFFQTNIDSAYTNTAKATFILPDDAGNTDKRLRCKGELKYEPLFGATMALLSGGDAADYVVVLNEATMKMKSLAEVALVLDNSGSMDFDNTGKNNSNNALTRMSLLKSAAIKLVTEMIDLGAKIQQTSDPVKFSIVPFASMVNVGPNNANATWMDTTGISPIHHEHLNWGTKSTATVINPTGYKFDGANGSKLNALNQPLTRFSIYNALQVKNLGTEASATTATSQCAVWKASSTSSTNTFSNCGVYNRTLTTLALPPVAAAQNSATYTWKGCVEARPNGLDMTDAAPNTAEGKFVPSFAPDHFNTSYYGSSTTVSGGINNWWPDYETKDYTVPIGYWNNNNSTQISTSITAANARLRETNVAKYFVVKPFTAAGSGGRPSQWSYYVNPDSTTRNDSSNIPVTGTFGGPNSGCTVNPITPLTGSKSTLTTAINNMAAFGGTNSAEGLAWGWRTLTPSEPFTEGSAISRKDIDRVIILLTDGANQLLSVPGTDYASNRSYYGAYGITGYKFNSTPGAVGTALTSASDARVFSNVTVSSPAFNSTKYTTAINARMAQICDNIKNDKFILMTVGLDLKPSTTSPVYNSPDQAAIDALKACAGTSRTRKDAAGAPAKLFWNTTSATLTQTFKEIGDELSNLRFTQ
jgi:Flp pilus assembly protein TadG